MSSNQSTTNASQSILDSVPTNYRIMLAGGISGSVAKSVTAPLARVVILFQVMQYCSVD